MKTAAQIVGLTLLAMALFAAFIKTFSDSVIECTCRDGSAAGKPGSGWADPASECARLCLDHGGGRPMTREESARQQAEWRSTHAK